MDPSLIVCFSSSQTAALDDLCRLAGQEEEWESSNNSTYYHHPNNNHNHHHHNNNNNHHYDITNKQKNNIFPCEEWWEWEGLQCQQSSGSDPTQDRRPDQRRQSVGQSHHHHPPRRAGRGGGQAGGGEVGHVPARGGWQHPLASCEVRSPGDGPLSWPGSRTGC